MIKVTNLGKQWGTGASAATILRDVSFEVADGTVCTLLGPSGCGKTTTLRCIAGLEHPDSGEIAFGDQVVFSSKARVDVEPDRRQIGMVFQSYAIWPHMTVAGNVAYPLEGERIPRSEMNRMVAGALKLVGLDQLADRPAPYLSGGQQQRVALARAVVKQPRVLLLDEPLSNLDAKLREQMRREIRRLQKQLGLTTLFVTHDQEEALALSDTVILMRAGEIVEAGAPLQLYENPQKRFTAEFLGLANFVPCLPVGAAATGEVTTVETAFGRFRARVRPSDQSETELFFRPHHAQLYRTEPDHAPAGHGVITEISFLGDTVDLYVTQAGQTIRLRSLPSFGPRVGEEVWFTLESERTLLFVPAGALAKTAVAVTA